MTQPRQAVRRTSAIAAPPSLSAVRPPTEAAPRAVRLVRGARACVLPLREEQRYLVGRHDAADLAFATADVSRIHGVLRFDGVWRYCDHGSFNGSFLLGEGDAEPLAPFVERELVAGDVVCLGSDEARLELLPEADDEPLPLSRSDAARELDQHVELAARTRVPIFLLGPSGSGKTHTARAIHERSTSRGAFVSINCARLPHDPTTLHSELLGHVRGAFTGAAVDRRGKLYAADGGTLFLDEVCSLPEIAQGFLLDVLEGEGDASPLGFGAAPPPPPVFRLISASKDPLARSQLRPDLRERLAEGFLWTLPTLDARKEDIPGLVERFVREQADMLGTRVTVDSDVLARATAAPWPGQIRQLRATFVALTQQAALDERRVTVDALDRHLAQRARAFEGEDVPDVVAAAQPGRVNPRSLTKDELGAVLSSTNGNRTEAARALGISRNTLLRKLKKFGLAQT